VAVASALATVASAAEGYHLLQKVQVTPGIGIFDYATVDGVNRRVYLSHGEEVVVLDADSNAVVGKIPAPQFDPSYGIGIAGRTNPYMGIHVSKLFAGDDKSPTPLPAPYQANERRCECEADT
jgi:hypothetical protein